MLDAVRPPADRTTRPLGLVPTAALLVVVVTLAAGLLFAALPRFSAGSADLSQGVKTTIIAQTGSELLALDPRSGQVLTQRPGAAAVIAVSADTRTVLAQIGEAIHVYRLPDWEERFRIPLTSEIPPVAVLEQLHYLGIALVLLVLGQTVPPLGVAKYLVRFTRYERHSVTALRVLTGLALVIVAFSEKLLNPELSSAFLRQYPHFNVLHSLFGWAWVSDRFFGDLAGVVEATIGILLITGVLTRVVILAMWVPFNLTVPLLPPVELLGHLPIFGIMYLLLLYGSGVAPQTAFRWLQPALTGELAAAQRRLAGEEEPSSGEPVPAQAASTPNSGSRRPSSARTSARCLQYR
jgi:uncharacterized membrane protein YphA (DoxX/SURF4 family)